jgi:hypothetical protein
MLMKVCFCATLGEDSEIELALAQRLRACEAGHRNHEKSAPRRSHAQRLSEVYLGKTARTRGAAERDRFSHVNAQTPSRRRQDDERGGCKWRGDGTVAGALGASPEDEETVRQAAHGYRQRRGQEDANEPEDTSNTR